MSIQVVALKIKNFLSISDVELKPGQVNQIVGKNNQGKTTLIKALEFAMKGSTDGSLVKFGEESAEVIVELSDTTQVRRRISADGKQTVDVKREGFKAPSPQAMLDGLFDQSSFNPLELLDPKKRTDAILVSIDLKVSADELAKELDVLPSNLPPLDFTVHGLKVLESAHKYYYQRRAEANKDANDKRKRWEIHNNDLPPEPKALSVDSAKVRDAISDQHMALAAVKEKLARVDAEIEGVAKIRLKVERYEGEIRTIDADIDHFEKQLSVLRTRREAGMKAIVEARVDLPTVLPDRSELEMAASTHERLISAHKETLAEIGSSTAVNKQYQMVGQMKKEAELAAAFAGDLTARVDILAGPLKTKLMLTAEMPIPGLTYVDGQFLVDGVPVDNLSSSKALRLAIGVARKLAKKTRLICIDGAEMLDEESFEALHQEIKGDGFIYFIAKVGAAFKADGDKVFLVSGGQYSEASEVK